LGVGFVAGALAVVEVPLSLPPQAARSRQLIKVGSAYFMASSEAHRRPGGPGSKQKEPPARPAISVNRKRQARTHPIPAPPYSHCQQSQPDVIGTAALFKVAD